MKKAKTVQSVPARTLPFPLSIVLVVLSSIGFACFWKTRQLEFVSKDLLSFYPLSSWLHTIAISSFLFVAIWLMYSALIAVLFDVKEKKNILFWDSFSYLAWLLPWLGASQVFMLVTFLILRGVTLYLFIVKEKAKLKPDSWIHGAVFILILLVQIQFNGTFSPKNWDNPMAAVNKGESIVNPVSSSLHHMFYVNSKMHDLSGFEPSSWGSMPHSPTSASSPVFGFITWLLDFPSADTEGFYRLLMGYFFFWCVFSSFGFYLFVRHGLGFSLPTSVIGGLLYTLGNHSLSLLASNYIPFFTGVYLCLPYALLCIRLAYRKESLGYALLSGSVFSLNFYLLQPHPDSLMHGTVFWGSYLVFLALIAQTQVSLQKRIQFTGAALIGFGIGSLYAVLPLLESMAAKEVKVWGHVDGQLVRFHFTQAIYGVLIPVLITLGFLLLDFAVGLKKLKETLTKKSEFWFFFAWFVLLCVFFLPGSDSPFIKFLMQIEFRKINFLGADRIFLYLGFTAIVLTLFGIEEALKEKSVSEETYKWGCILAAVLPFFLSYKDANYSYLLIGTAFAITGAISFYLHKQKQFQFHYLFLMLATSFALINEGANEWQSSKLNNNPNNCKYYLSLRGLNTKTRLLVEDYPTNRQMLKNRLSLFEEQLASSPTAGEMRKTYQSQLATLGTSSALSVSDAKFPEFIEQASMIADELYLKEHRCPYPKDFGGIYDPNTVVLFDKVKDRYLRIHGLTGVTMNGGIGEGLFINDTTSGVDPRFMWGYPPTAAMYFFPGEYYKNVGDYESLMLGRQKASVLSNPTYRRLFNISGIDAFNMLREDYNNLKDLDEMKVIENDIQPVVLVRDQKSYGIAYFAKRTIFQAPRDLSFTELKPPFHTEDTARFETYKKTVNALTEQLSALTDKHSAIIETTSSTPNTQETTTTDNQLTISNILGNKAAFKVNCLDSHCRLVFNQSNVLGWNAYADKQPLKIERANFAFMSVEVPKGEHLVWFEHRPWGIILGSLLTSLCFAISGFFLFKTSRS